jgi:Tol biopolymer transport system component
MRTAALVVAITLSLAAVPSQRAEIVFARVWPNAGQVGLFVADADGSNEHPLLGLGQIDYDPVWAPDGGSIVFTSDREGSADLFRVKPDGTGLERLTDSPAYDDQAAFSPDGKQLVFVTTRNGGTADLWTMDLQTKKGKALTSGPGGDFRPSWSPDGKWIAFSPPIVAARLPMGRGRWEHLRPRTFIWCAPMARAEAITTPALLQAARSSQRTARAWWRTAWTRRTRSRSGARILDRRTSTIRERRWTRVWSPSISPPAR